MAPKKHSAKAAKAKATPTVPASLESAVQQLGRHRCACGGASQRNRYGTRAASDSRRLALQPLLRGGRHRLRGGARGREERRCGVRSAERPQRGTGRKADPDAGPASRSRPARLHPAGNAGRQDRRLCRQRRPSRRPPRTPHAERDGGGPEGNGARELFVRHARRDGRSVAILRAVDYGDSCVIEAEVYPAGGRSAEPTRPGPYTFADVHQATAFMTEAVEALMVLRLRRARPVAVGKSGRFAAMMLFPPRP